MPFILTHPHESRPSLVVHICSELAEAAINGLRLHMFELGCPNGLVFDPEYCVILRDQFLSMAPESIQPEGEPFMTDVVPAAAGSRVYADERRAGLR